MARNRGANGTALVSDQACPALDRSASSLRGVRGLRRCGRIPQADRPIPPRGPRPGLTPARRQRAVDKSRDAPGDLPHGRVVLKDRLRRRQYNAREVSRLECLAVHPVSISCWFASESSGGSSVLSRARPSLFEVSRAMERFLRLSIAFHRCLPPPWPPP